MDSLDEALTLANDSIDGLASDSIYGLTAGVSRGKAGLFMDNVAQFLREQSHTIVE